MIEVEVQAQVGQPGATSVNEEIGRLRLAATRALFERRDVVIIASVSCIYGLGDSAAYHGMLLLAPGSEPRSIIKDIANPLLQLSTLDYHDRAFLPPNLGEVDVNDPVSLAKAIAELEKEMRAAAKRLEFEQAAALRDRIKELRSQQIFPG